MGRTPSTRKKSKGRRRSEVTGTLKSDGSKISPKQKTVARRPPKLRVMCIWEEENRPKYEFAASEQDFLYLGKILFKLPNDHKMYKKREALHQISKTVKYSEERGAMICFMIDEGYVPCTAKYLYQLIKRTEEYGLPIGNDEWSSRCRQTTKAATRKPWNMYEMQYNEKELFPKHNSCRRKKVELDWAYDHARPNLWAEKGWKASIFFSHMIPVKFRDHLPTLFEKTVQRNCRGDKRNFYGEVRNRWRRIDICSYIGNCDFCDKKTFGTEIEFKDSSERFCRIYFDPEAYPPPENIHDGSSTSTFEELRHHIRFECERSGSPVYCNGGNEKGRTFICIHNRRDRGSCPFGFTICWDTFGYYIHLMARFSMNSNGCPFHLCNGVK